MTAAIKVAEACKSSGISPRRKVCSCCGQELPITAFHRRAHHVRSGVRAACRACTAERAKAARDAKKPQLAIGDAQARRRAAVRQATRAAIRTGVLSPEPCRDCGVVEVEAHHPRYDGPDPHLDVVWLCRRCHAREHGVQDWTRQLPLPLGS